MTSAEPTTSDTPSALDVIPMRVFEYVYIDGTKDRFASHLYDTQTGHLVFIDKIKHGEGWILYYRKTIAAGQWRSCTEITGVATSERAH